MGAERGELAQAWRFVVLRSPEQRAAVGEAAGRALAVIEPVYGMTRPADDDHEPLGARNNRATYELHDRAASSPPCSSHLQRYPRRHRSRLPGGSIYPAMQNFLLAARAQGLGACLTSWASYGGEAAAARAVVRPRRLAAGRPRRGRLAAGQPRTGASAAAGRGRRPRSLGSARHRFTERLAARHARGVVRRSSAASFLGGIVTRRGRAPRSVHGPTSRRVPRCCDRARWCRRSSRPPPPAEASRRGRAP